MHAGHYIGLALRHILVPSLHDRDTENIAAKKRDPVQGADGAHIALRRKLNVHEVRADAPHRLQEIEYAGLLPGSHLVVDTRAPRRWRRGVHRTRQHLDLDLSMTLERIRQALGVVADSAAHRRVRAGDQQNAHDADIQCSAQSHPVAVHPFSPMLYKEISSCRLCNARGLDVVFDLGHQALTGIFPKSDRDDLASGPLVLAKCSQCHLVQLRHNYDLAQLYGATYGYRSGLNQSMVRHLHRKVERIRSLVKLQPGDLVVDIGSNDSTLLQAYPAELKLLGVDPSGPKFR